MYFDRGNIPSLYNVFANNSVYYYFSIKTLVLIFSIFSTKEIYSSEKQYYSEPYNNYCIIELSLNFVVLQYREDNFIDISRIENIRKITNLKDPIPTSKLDKFIDPLEKQFRPFSATYWAQGISTCSPRTGNDSISPRLLKLMKEVWNYDQKTIQSIMTGNSESLLNKNTKLFEKKFTLCDEGHFLRESKKIQVAKNKEESSILIKKLLGNNDLNQIDIIEDDSGFLKNKSKDLITYPYEISPKFEVNKISLDLIPQDKPFVIYLAMNYDEKWKIKGNSKNSQLYPANLSFTGIFIPPNTNKIELNYESGNAIKLFKLMILSSTISILSIMQKAKKSSQYTFIKQEGFNYK